MNTHSELHFLQQVTADCIGKTTGRDAVWQLAPVFASIPYSETGVEDLRFFEERVSRAIPRLAAHGRERAKRAFVRTKDSITKPSYIKRLTRAVDGRASQLEILGDRFLSEPTSGGLVFSVFEPSDLLRRQRPGYVPCLVSGSVLLHGSQLHLNAFFRSQSIVEFGLYDLLFLRGLQLDLVKSFRRLSTMSLSKRRRVTLILPGPLNLQCGRVIVQSRLARHGTAYIKRAEVIARWMRVLSDVIARKSDSHVVPVSDHSLRTMAPS